MEIIVHYHWAPHFRRQIFEALAKQGNNKVTFYVGENVGVDGVQPLKEIEGAATKLLRNYFLGPLIFQVFWPFSREYMYSHRVVLGDIKFLPAYVSLLLSLVGFGETHFWTHGVLKKEKGLKWFVRKSFYSLANSILTYSERSAVLLREGGVTRPVKSIGNSNFSSSTALKVSERVETLNETRKHLVYIGRLTQGKNLEDLVMMVGRLPTDVGLKLIGAGNAVEPLKKLIEQKGLADRVWFVGEVYDQLELVDITSDCIAGVVPGAVGLAGFTYILLGLDMIYCEQGITHKPEMHILEECGYGVPIHTVNSTDIDSAFKKLHPIGRSLREDFVVSNSAEAVADRLVKGLGYE